MPYLLNLFYLALVLVASPWLIYEGARKGKYRTGWREKLFGLVPRRAGSRPCVWLHAVSVGEVNLLAPLIAEMRRCRPAWECVVSSTSLTGYTLAKKKYSDLTVFYCPLDFSWAVRTALRRIRPDCLVLAELELWPNLIRAAAEAGTRIAVINGRLSEKSFRNYSRIKPLVRATLSRLNLVAAQNAEFADRFRALGVSDDALCITGSIKFDGAQTDRGNPATIALRQAAGFADEDIVFLAGSTQQPEEALSVAAYERLRDRYPRLRLVIVPRHPERFDEVAQLLAASGIAWQRRSRLAAEGPRAEARVLLVDTVGELGAWWGTATVAFVGGSLHPRGGQNMIEPAAYGAAVSFGPNTRNFRDIVAQLLAADAAVVVADSDALASFVTRCLAEPAYADGLGRRARELVASQLGATTKTVTRLAQLVDQAEQFDARRSRSAA